MIGCPRSCLNVVAADKGLVGRLQFREDGDLIDCTRMGVTGKAIPVMRRPFLGARAMASRRWRAAGYPALHTRVDASRRDAPEAYTPSPRRRRDDDGRASQARIDKITEIRSDAEFVLLVEKDAAYNRLAEDGFYNQFPCILMGKDPT